MVLSYSTLVRRESCDVPGMPETHFDAATLDPPPADDEVLPLPPELLPLPPEPLLDAPDPVAPVFDPPPVAVVVPLPAPEPCAGPPFGPLPTAGPSIFAVQPVSRQDATKRPRLQVNIIKHLVLRSR
jgi:hypothetical protein